MRNESAEDHGRSVERSGVETVERNRQHCRKSLGLLVVVLFGCMLAAFPVLSVGAGRETANIDSSLDALGFIKLQNDPDAPDFTLQDVSGKSVRLTDQRGKVVFLTFWTTW